MAPLVLLIMALGLARVSTAGAEMALSNITRFNFGGGDLFSIPGTECGMTRCMEVSHGTALSTMGAGGDCVCQCHGDTPAFREDQRICVNHIDECQMASFGGATKPQIPFVFLPLKGQIIYPSKEIIFTDVDEAMCVVTSAQYLTTTGWMTLRDVIDNDVPFSLYRDEGKTFLQWRGSVALHTRLEGRLVAAHVLCSAHSPPRLTSSCAAFRVAGTSRNALLDVRSIPFHAGEIVSSELSSQNQGLSVLECLAIGVCVLMLIFVYAAGIVFYIHYKQRQKRKDKDPEMNQSSSNSDNGSVLESRIDMDNVRLKTNPLLNLDGMGMGADFLNDAGLSDVSERTEETMDSSTSHNQKFQKFNTNVISATVHNRRKKPTRPSIRSATPDRMHERFQRRSASPDTFERAPHSELSIVDCSMEGNANHHSMSSSNAEPAIRRKLYFNPVFFETEHLKNPPPAAIDFLVKIREVMSIAKEKMTSKRFIPMLSDIPEEELYHTIDLGWDIPCARKGRRFSVISLKRENSRRSGHCGGCPGCDSSSTKEKEPKVTLTRSNSCKSCVSDDYKQRIVRKWLDEVPIPHQPNRPAAKSVAKVSGTPRIVEPNKKNSEMTTLVIPPEPARRDDIKPIKPTSAETVKTSPKILTTVKKSPKNLNREELITPSKLIENLKKQEIIISPKLLENAKKEEFKLASKLIESKMQKLLTPSKTSDNNKQQEYKSPAKSSESCKKSDTKTSTKSTENNKKTDIKAISKTTEENKKLDLKNPIEDKRKLEIQVITNDIIDEKLKAVPIAIANMNINNTDRSTTPETNKVSPRNVNNATRRVRKKLPPPPPPPVETPIAIEPPELPKEKRKVEPDVKVKMEAVIKELNKCRRTETNVHEVVKAETAIPIPAPRIVIPVLAADSHYYSDDNTLSRNIVRQHSFVDLDSLERNMLKKRRFSMACGQETGKNEELCKQLVKYNDKDKNTRSWFDIRKTIEGIEHVSSTCPDFENRSLPLSEVFINSTIEPLYGNVAMPTPGPLTIQVRGSPVESRRNIDQFDPDTLDRKPKSDNKKRVDKILLKSGGSFKYNSFMGPNINERKNPPEPALTKKIGSLRQIYEAKAKAQEEEIRYHRGIYERRRSVVSAYDSDDLAAFMRSVKTPDLIRQTEPQKPPVPPKQRRVSDIVSYSNLSRESPPRRSPEEKERLAYNRNENIIARRSGRRSNRTRSRRTDLRKLTRTEDSGYLSTDSNESKRRASYLMQLKPRMNLEPIKMMQSHVTQIQRGLPLLQIESDTDDMESLCDGRSESGGESIETDSVFFGNFDESKQMLEDLDLSTFDPKSKHIHHEDQIDSGFMGETNIILSGDSDSEHRSVISIITGSNGRASSASISKLDDSRYMHSVEC